MKIAVIGSGISGMSAAHFLAESHDVTLFEAGNRLGGHTASFDVHENGETVSVDTGFIVFNDRTYPNFVNLMDSLNIESHESLMSFCVSDKNSGLEYAGTNLNTVFAQRNNILKPSYLRMLKDILKFNRFATEHVSREGMKCISLREYLTLFAYSDQFRDLYLIPMSAAIWSSSPDGMLDMPADFLIRFFNNHGLLTVNDQPQWRVISGGSKQYIPALTARYRDNIRLDSPVSAVTRTLGSNGLHYVTINSKHGTENFDQVVFACHSDQALSILADPSPDENRILGSIPYRANSVVLHKDNSLMPDLKRCWSSWNVRLDEHGGALTYHMNKLQQLTCNSDYFVTLNSNGHIDKDQIIASFEYDHPIFTEESIRAQQSWHEINGIQSTWFCGAYWRNGFHEDGVWSALRVFEKINKSESIHVAVNQAA